jgi:hypothetical protein
MSSQSVMSHTKKIKIGNLLKTLTSIIQNRPNDTRKLGLFGGLSGELLFLWQTNKYDNNLVDENVFNQKIEFLQDSLPIAAEKFNLSVGLTGLAWFFEYINQTQVEDYDSELCEDIDDFY